MKTPSLAKLQYVQPLPQLTHKLCTTLCQRLSIHSSSSLFLSRARTHSSSALILGTGPSAQTIDSNIINSHDLIIYVNFAVKWLHTDINARQLFLCSDVLRALQVVHSPYIYNLESLGKDSCFLYFTAPELIYHFWTLDPYLTCIRLPNYSPIVSKRVCLPKCIQPLTYRGRICSSINISHRISCIHRVTDEWLSTGISRGDQPPHFGESSAFDAIFLAISLGYKNLTLVGCDFNEGRAASLFDELGIPPSQAFSYCNAILSSIGDSCRAHSISITRTLIND
jgi:hypothetical protein